MYGILRTDLRPASQVGGPDDVAQEVGLHDLSVVVRVVQEGLALLGVVLDAEPVRRPRAEALRAVRKHKAI